MNKKKFIISSLAMATLFALSFAFSSQPQKPIKEASAISSNVAWDYMAYDDNNFEITTYDGCTYHDINFFRANRTDSAFFDGGQRSFNALDNFFNGTHDEGWRGELKSATWTQKDDYVTFTLGGRNSSVKFYLASNDSEITAAAVNSNDYFQDPKLAFNMIVRVVDLSSYKNQLLYLKVFDVETENIGATTFGALKVSQNANDVARTISVHKNHLSKRNPDGEDWRKDTLARDYTLTKYNEAAEYSAFKSIILDNADIDFEDYDQCTNLALDNSTVSGFADRGAGYDSIRWGYNEAYCTAYEWDWDERMPFNKQGDAFFRGDYGGDGARYTLLTNDFKFSGTGYFSIRLAGNGTKVALIDASTGAELASATNTSYKDGDKWNVFSSKAFTCTMTKYIIDAREHLNKTVRIAISDTSTAGWSILMFDELITKYNSLPTFGLTEVRQTPKDQTNRYGVIPSILVQTNTGAVKEAYDFLQSYFSVFRAEGSFKYLECNFSKEELQNLCNGYSGLSADAKAIVDASDDFDRGNVAGDYYFLRVNTSNKVGTIVSNIIAKYNLTPADNSGSSNSLFAKANNSVGLIVIVASMLSLLAVGGFLFFKKKKQN